jgi:hypothetical protein
MSTAGERPQLSDADLSRLLTLLKGADSVELLELSTKCAGNGVRRRRGDKNLSGQPGH